MGTPAEKTATTDNTDNKSVVSFVDKVNATADVMAKKEDGSWEFPEDTPEEVQHAALIEKRRRDTQSALATTKNDLAATKAEKEGLVKLVKESSKFTLTEEQQTELDELKHSDPDEWRKKMNELESAQKGKVDTTLSELSTSARTAGEVGEREVILEAFLDDNPGLVINDEVLANDIPPRILKALESGEVTFMTFLGNVKEYLTSGKTIADNPGGDDLNLSNIGGSDTPGEEAERKGVDDNYENDLY